MADGCAGGGAQDRAGHLLDERVGARERYRIALLEALRDRGTYRELNTTPAVAA